MLAGPWGKRLLEAVRGNCPLQHHRTTPPLPHPHPPPRTSGRANCGSIIITDIKQSSQHRHDCVTCVVWAQCKITKWVKSSWLWSLHSKITKGEHVQPQRMRALSHISGRKLENHWANYISIKVDQSEQSRVVWLRCSYSFRVFNGVAMAACHWLIFINI